MTSPQGGSKRNKNPPSSPSPPSSSSEDNGFSNRPKVVGLFVKNLSKEELDELAKEGIYGPTGNPNDRPRDGGSQRSLDIPGSSKDGQGHHLRATSRTPQPPRKSGVTEYREPSSRFLPKNLVRREHHGSLPMEGDWPRRLEDRPEQASPAQSARGSSEFSAGWWERPSAASPRGSSIDIRVTGEDPRVAAKPRRFGEVPKRPEVPSARISTEPSGDQRQSPPPYPGLSPPKYTEYEEPSSRTSKIYPKTATRIYQVDDKEHPDSPYERPSSPLEENKEAIAESTDSRADVDKTNGITSPSEKLTSPESKKSESPPMKRIGSRTQDSTRLRPPLAGTAGTSADSGTGDSGSAEIQADVVTPQAASGDVLDTKESKIESRSWSGTRTPGSKGGKQTVKPFTKESRLENKTVQLVRDYGFQPKRKMSVEDGAVLPNKFEPFPNDLYGRPLEEIDNFIYDEVSS